MRSHAGGVRVGDGTHLIRPPHGARYAAHVRAFDRRGVRSAARRRRVPVRLALCAAFPSQLRSIHDPPPGLFVRGAAELELLARPSVAIVGARACSGYGSSVARSLARDLAAAGLVVVSGLARGIDAEAHRGALEAGGTTVAVLGCGIDRDYPAAHRELARRIAETGLIVSEYAPGVEPAPWRFPARNRIVAGLSVRDGRRRSTRAKRRTDHRRPRVGGGERGVRRPRRDHVVRFPSVRTTF